MDMSGIRWDLGPLTAHVTLEIVPQCVSTNLVLKERAAELPEWYTLIAGHQTGGRGRLGRRFCSPEGTGLYMSVLLRPKLAAEDAFLITPAAAVAVCRAAEALGSDKAEIKWVNDVLIHGKKVCGILTEAVSGPEPGALGHVVLGVGVNVTQPAGGFPPEIAGSAGAVFPRWGPDRRGPLAAAFLREFYKIYAALPDRGFIAEYRSRSCLTGRYVDVLRGGGARKALVLGIDDGCRLLVRYGDGTEEALFSGEVSVRPERDWD